MDTPIHASFSSDNKGTLSMDIRRSRIDLPSTCTINPKECRANIIDKEHSDTNTAVTYQFCESKESNNIGSQDISNTNRNNADNVDHSDTVVSNLIELSDLGIVEHTTVISGHNIDDLDMDEGIIEQDNDVDLLNICNTDNWDAGDINKVNNSVSVTNNDVPVKTQCDLNQSDTENDIILRSPGKIDETSNTLLVKPTYIENVQQSTIRTQKLDGNNLTNIVDLSTSTENFDQSSTNSENVVQPTLTEIMEDTNDDVTKVHQRIVQVNADNTNRLPLSTENLDQTNINYENVVQPTLTENMKGTDVTNLNQIIVQLNADNTHQVNVDKSSGKMAQCDVTPERLDQSSISTANLDQSSISTRNLDQPSTSTRNWDQPSTSTGNWDQPSTSTGHLDQPSTSTRNWDQPSTSTGNMDKPSTSTGNLDKPSTSTGNWDQPSTSTGNWNQPSTSTGNLNQGDSKMYEFYHRFGIIVKKLDTCKIVQETLNSPPESNDPGCIPLGSPGSAKVQNSSIKKETKEEAEEKVKLFQENKGPYWHKVVTEMVTPPVIAKNLPEVFKNLPIYGVPENRASVEKFYDREIRKFVGCDLNDVEYEELQDYCSVDNLLTGSEFKMPTTIPNAGIQTCQIDGGLPGPMPKLSDKPDMFVLRKLKARMQKDPRNMYAKKLKYRGVRLINMSSQEDQLGIPDTQPPDIQPGIDLLFRVRVYRPFVCCTPRIKAQIRGRHSVFSCDMVVCGRQPLTVIRDRIVCRNDVDLRLDVSRRPYDIAPASSKEMFPSGFLFINNVFYVDCRPGCHDISAGLRDWATARGIGDFLVRDMAQVQMQDVSLRLAHPEVYVHQGNCEHVFLISEIRLATPRDPLYLSCYPAHSAVSHNQTIYCTTCADFGAKWVVTGCERVPFDPAFFCDFCFKLFLYRDTTKLGEFAAFAYKGNELSMLKPQS